ncbi:hypothetical protein L1987_20547 [Smallanthus sonchifolius]|uniref:Uncharacterized protein n=1 Tax=Smallanthus sonchifolius TaxID=185202 RepID=A0ACB9ISU4_9ASTR|nr:hypothetical protein L1987_20547 [Smallanthus sonchifolius]
MVIKPSGPKKKERSIDLDKNLGFTLRISIREFNYQIGAIDDGEDSGEGKGCDLRPISVPTEGYDRSLEGLHPQGHAQGHRELDQRYPARRPRCRRPHICEELPGKREVGAQVLKLHTGHFGLIVTGEE